MTESELLLSTAIGRFGELLAQSEERISKTNEIVSKLADGSKMQMTMMEDISTKYMHHVDALAHCRDELVAQNGELIKMVTRAQNRIDKCDQRIEAIFDKVLAKLNSNDNSSKSEVKIM